jgi:hypothetical protein
MKGLVIPGVYLRFQLSLLVLFTLPTELNCIAFEMNYIEFLDLNVNHYCTM